MARLVAVTIVVIAILSAIPIIRHTWWTAPDISTHGQAIDDWLKAEAELVHGHSSSDSNVPYLFT